MRTTVGPLVWGLVLLGVLAVTGLEMAAVVWIAGEIGWWTIALMLATSAVGVYLTQREWRKEWSHLVKSLARGEIPTGRMADATLVLLGGVLLVAPGFFTDVAGLFLLVSFTRAFVRSALGWAVSRFVPRRVHSSTVVKGDVAESETLIPGIKAQDPGPTKNEP